MVHFPKLLAAFVGMFATLGTASAFHSQPLDWSCPSVYEGNLCSDKLYDENVLLYVEATSEGDDVYLSFNDSEAGAANFHRLEPDLASGAVGAAQALASGVNTQSWEISLKDKVPYNMYLNLSRHIGGRLYWSNTPSSAAGDLGIGTDVTVVRVELLVDGKRLGGYEEVSSPGMQFGTWSWITLNAWPEQRVIPEGSDLKLRISRAGGLGDLLIGTAGAHQSQIELRFSSIDPLAGALYLVNRKIVSYAQDAASVLGVPAPDAPAEKSDASSGPSAAWFAFAVPSAGLSAVTRRRRALVAVCLALVALSLAGCAGAPRPENVSAGPTATEGDADVDIEKDPKLNGSRLGAIEGTVQNHLGLPVRAASVSVLATIHFARTDKYGAFAFQDVPPGEYKVRVDANGYYSLERGFEVEAGSVTRMNLTLAPLEERQGFRDPHRHGNWGESNRVHLQDKTFDLSPCSPNPQSASGLVLPTNTYTFFHRCEHVIDIDPYKPIPSGTAVIEIYLNWTAGPGNPKELGLRAVSPFDHKMGVNVGWASSGGSMQWYGARPSGDSFRVAIYPNEADPGHQKFTNWQFFVQTPAFDVAHNVRPFTPATFSVAMQMFAHKGVVPYEPAHRDFWGTNQSIPLFSEVSKGPAPNDASLYGPSYFPGRYCWELPAGAFIPPGTKELKGYLRWEGSAIELTQWRIAYRTADGPTSRQVNRWATMEGSGTNRTFTITPTTLETDQFYQPHSYWKFCVDDEDEAVNSGAGTKWTFGLTAYKDLTYADT